MLKTPCFPLTQTERVEQERAPVLVVSSHSSPLLFLPFSWSFSFTPFDKLCPSR